MSYGALSHLAISAQESFGTATSSWEFFPFISESLTTEVEQLVEEGMRARFDPGPTHEGLMTVAGDIVFEPHPILIGHMLRGVTGQASSTLVDSVTTWEFNPVQSDFTAGICALPPFTLQIYRDSDQAWQFTDTLINQLTIDVNAGEIVKATASVISRISSLMTKSSPTFPEGDPWTWDAASISHASSAHGETESISIVVNNNIEGVPLVDGNKFHGKMLRTGMREITYSSEMNFVDQREYDKFRVGSSQSIIAALTGATLTTSQNDSLVFDMPEAKHSSNVINVADAGRISATVDGVAKYHTSSATAMTVTMTNTRTSYTP